MRLLVTMDFAKNTAASNVAVASHRQRMIVVTVVSSFADPRCVMTAKGTTMERHPCGDLLGTSTGNAKADNVLLSAECI